MKEHLKGMLWIKKSGAYGLILGLIFLLAWQSEAVISAACEAMVLCYRSVIPSLFPFFVLSGWLVFCGFADLCARRLSPLMMPVFCVGGAGSLALVMGLISGYPTGAKMTAELYSVGHLSCTEAERLLPFCNNSGPLFVVGAVGSAMLGSRFYGMVLYVVHVASAVLVGVIFRFYKRGEPVMVSRKRQRTCEVMGILKGFSTSVKDSVQTMMQVCGYIILFAALGTGIMAVLKEVAPSFVLFGFRILLEVAGGTFFITQSALPQRVMLSLLSFCIGTGGLCVMMQTAGILSDKGLGFKTYVPGKLLQGVLSGVMTYFIYPFLPMEAAKTQNAATAVSAILFREQTRWQEGWIFLCIAFCFLSAAIVLWKMVKSER
ncbi:MAG: hypothetical protein IKW06_05265 [Clostridia bacterium]|nr:hypothetical protein [Clostridia bacterium]